MKILIVGAVGSGKTTYAKKYGEFYELDKIVHDDVFCKKRSEIEQKEIIKEIDKSDWVIEGMLRNNLYLLEYADKIIYLDVSYKIRRKRILSRWIKQKLGIEKCSYKADFNMLKLMFKWNKDFENNKQNFEKMLEKYKEKLEVIK